MGHSHASNMDLMTGLQRSQRYISNFSEQVVICIDDSNLFYAAMQMGLDILAVADQFWDLDAISPSICRLPMVPSRTASSQPNPTSNPNSNSTSSTHPTVTLIAPHAHRHLALG